MTASDLSGPAPKTPMPPLDARAPRPPVVRLRRGVLVALVMAGAGLVGGSLAWAFVVQPELRERSLLARQAGRPDEARGAVRPSEAVTDGPASYAQLDRLPEPRRLGRERPPAERPPPRGPAPGGGEPTAAAVPSPASEARASGLFFAAASAGQPPAARGEALSGAAKDYAAAYNAHALLPPLSPFEVKAGSVIPAALLTAIDTERPGPVSATVSEAVFDSVSGRHLVIPQGARLLGRHEGESRHGDRRAYIVWERLILPNGKSLMLAGQPGVDAQGAVGVRGTVDRRLGAVAVATLFAGAITTLGQAARDQDDDGGGLWGDAGDAAAIEAAQVGGKLIDRELDVRPSIRLRPGERVRVLVTRDLVLEPYAP